MISRRPNKRASTEKARGPNAMMTSSMVTARMIDILASNRVGAQGGSRESQMAIVPRPTRAPAIGVRKPIDSQNPGARRTAIRNRLRTVLGAELFHVVFDVDHVRAKRRLIVHYCAMAAAPLEAWETSHISSRIHLPDAFLLPTHLSLRRKASWQIFELLNHNLDPVFLWGSRLAIYVQVDVNSLAAGRRYPDVNTCSATTRDGIPGDS